VRLGRKDTAPVGRPPRLRAGARVALVTPAGPIEEAAIDSALRNCEAFGFEGVLAPGARSRHGYLAGEDEARANDLQRALDEPSIDAVWALRGGYGAVRLLDRLDLRAVRRRPKPFIGFSDNTALHSLLTGAGLVSFHGPHAPAAFPEFTEQCFRRVLFEASPAGILPAPASEPPVRAVRSGRAEGVLLGGNLALLGSLCGTRWSPSLKGAILVIEDVGEAAYRIDRTWTQLRMAGCLDEVRGIVLGRFTNRPERPGEREFADVLRELVEPIGVPVLADAPVGHVDLQWTVPLGVRARLDADAGTLEILEAAVS
jgi:muramoyltetrapeptide carboxypeptidase